MDGPLSDHSTQLMFISHRPPNLLSYRTERILVSRRGLHTHPGPGAGWLASSAHMGVPLQGLSVSLWGVGMARKEAGGGVLLGDLTVGGAAGAQGLASPSHNRFRNHPLASGVWVLECSLLPPPAPRPVSLRCGIQLGAADLTLAPQSPVRGGGSTQRKELLPGCLLGGDLSRIVCAPGLLATRLSQVGRDPSGSQGGHVDLQSHLSLHKAGG